MIGTIRIAWVLGILVIASLVLLPIHLLLLLLKHPLRNRLPRTWHRIALGAIGVRVHVHGRIEARRPLMIASNHVSWLDILVLSSVVEANFVARADLRDWPIVGQLARLQRSIFIRRKERQLARDQADEMASRLNAGDVVVFFPEGTTTSGNRLGELKSSLFAAASSAARFAPEGVVHVQPVALAYIRVHGMAMGHYNRPLVAFPGTVELLPHVLEVLRTGAIDVDLRFGRTVAVTPETSRKDVSAAVRDDLRDMLETSLRGR